MRLTTTGRRAVLAALAVLAACQTGEPAEGYAVLGREAVPLRSDFDAAAGSVRAIILASPT